MLPSFEYWIGFFFGEMHKFHHLIIQPELLEKISIIAWWQYIRFLYFLPETSYTLVAILSTDRLTIGVKYGSVSELHYPLDKLMDEEMKNEYIYIHCPSNYLSHIYPTIVFHLRQIAFKYLVQLCLMFLT